MLAECTDCAASSPSHLNAACHATACPGKLACAETPTKHRSHLLPTQTCAWASPAHPTTSAGKATARATAPRVCAVPHRPRPTAPPAAEAAPARAACAQVGACCACVLSGWRFRERQPRSGEHAGCMHRLRIQQPEPPERRLACNRLPRQLNCAETPTKHRSHLLPTQTCAWASPAHPTTSAGRATARAAAPRVCAVRHRPRPTARPAAGAAPARAACAQQVGARCTCVLCSWRLRE
jgi:hypothetical protein